MTEAASIAVLVLRAAGRICAIRLTDVVETLRPLRVESLPELPAYILGMSVLRGAAVPVVHLGLLFGVPDDTPPRRWVSLRLADRGLALAVDEVQGVRDLKAGHMESLPSMMQAVAAIESVGVVDRQLVSLMTSGRLLTEDPWGQIEARQAAATPPSSAAPDESSAPDAPAAEPPSDEPPRRGKRGRNAPGRG